MIPVVSYSSLNSYAQCPYSYYLRYIIRESVESADFTGTLPGNVAHKLAELFFKKKNEEGVVDWSIFETEFESVFKKYASSPNIYFGPNAFAPSKIEAKKKVKIWTMNLADMLKEQDMVKNITISEFRFGSHKSPLKLTEKLLFTGGPDIFASDSLSKPGLLVDFKASDTSFHINEKQVFLYALALMKDLGVSVSMAGFFLFKSRTFIWKRVSKERLKETVDWAESLVDLIMKEDFHPSPSKASCRLCAYNSVCKHSTFFNKKVSSLKSILELKTGSCGFTLQEEPEL